MVFGQADAQAVDAFYCPDPVLLSAKRNGPVMQWRGRAVSIEDLLRVCACRRGVQLCHAAFGARFGGIAVADLAVSEGYRNPAPGQDCGDWLRRNKPRH